MSSSRTSAWFSRFRANSAAWAWLARRHRTLIAASLVGLGLLELGLHFYFSRRAPDIAAWQALKPEVERLVPPGTLIVVAPRWAEPNARLALGDALMPLQNIARPDETAFERALEIGMLGDHASELAGWRLEREQRAGRFQLRLLENPRPETVLYDFMAQLSPPHAEVSVTRNGQRQECRFTSNAKVENGDLHGHPTYPKRRFNCPGEGNWLFAGVTVVEDQNYQPRQCIWAHPARAGVLELRFPDVPIGAKIRGYGALSYWVERERKGSPIDLTVLVGAEAVGTFTHRDGEGWKAFEFDTQRFAGQRASVEFRVTSRRPRHREFCFQADVR